MGSRASLSARTLLTLTSPTTTPGRRGFQPIIRTKQLVIEERELGFAPGHFRDIRTCIPHVSQGVNRSPGGQPPRRPLEHMFERWGWQPPHGRHGALCARAQSGANREWSPLPIGTTFRRLQTEEPTNGRHRRGRLCRPPAPWPACPPGRAGKRSPRRDDRPGVREQELEQSCSCQRRRVDDAGLWASEVMRGAP